MKNEVDNLSDALKDPIMTGETWHQGSIYKAERFALWPIWERRLSDPREDPEPESDIVVLPDRVYLYWWYRPLRMAGMNERGEINNAEMVPEYFERGLAWQVAYATSWIDLAEEFTPETGMDRVRCVPESSIWRPKIFGALDDEHKTLDVSAADCGMVVVVTRAINERWITTVYIDDEDVGDLAWQHVSGGWHATKEALARFPREYRAAIEGKSREALDEYHIKFAENVTEDLSQDATLGDTLRELRPVETVTKCEDCPCCHHTPPFVHDAACSDEPGLTINRRIMHADCPRRGKRTEWSL